MKIDLSDYEKVAEFGPVEKYERSVMTPGYPESEAESRIVFYESGHYFKVSRVSTLGWSVTEYDENGRPLRRSASENLAYFDSEEEAHEQAREWVEEYVQQQ